MVPSSRPDLDVLLDRRQVLKGLVGVGLGMATGGAAHGFLYERHHLELTRTQFPVSGLPEALRGLRIGVLTDIHRSQTVRTRWSRRGRHADGASGRT